MRLTITHAHFWAQHTEPQWARAVRKAKPLHAHAHTAIHACINAHAGNDGRPHSATNLVALLRSARKHWPSVGEYMAREIARPGSWSQAHDKRRFAHAVRWLGRLGWTRDPESPTGWLPPE